MPELPLPLEQYMAERLWRIRRLAWFSVDANGHVVESGGELDAHGLTGIRPGSAAVNAVPALEGSIPHHGEPLQLPYVQTADHLYTEMHLLQTSALSWVLLLDATPEAVARQRMQQKVNELELSVGPAGVDGEPVHRGRTEAAVLRRVSSSGTRQDVTALAVEIRAFTSFVERGSPETSARLLRRYLRSMTSALREGDGWITSQRGSSVEAVFGLRETSVQSGAILAVQAAAVLLEEIASIRRRIEQRGRPAPAVSLGLASGETTLLMVGTPTQGRLVAVGETVDRAALGLRLARSGEVVCDAATYARLDTLKARFRSDERRFDEGPTPPPTSAFVWSAQRPEDERTSRSR